MKVGVWLCACASTLSERLDFEDLREAAAKLPFDVVVREHELLCSAEGQEALAAALAAEPVDRVVVVGCSPREHQSTFERVLVRAGLHPTYLQMANVREQVAWVTTDPALATAKAEATVRATIHRAAHHGPTPSAPIEVETSALVLGAGPAGMTAALTLVEAGRKVILVERAPAIGGRPVRGSDDEADGDDCGACLLQPVVAGVLRAARSGELELLTLADAESVAGRLGAFTVRLRRKARFVDDARCTGCGECIAPCPATAPDPFALERSERPAISFAWSGAQPSVPYLDAQACARGRDAPTCSACRDACPIPGVIDFDGADQCIERTVGAVIVAIGAEANAPHAAEGLGEGPGSDERTGATMAATSAGRVPGIGAPRLAAILDLALDARGFFAPQHARLEPLRTRVPGIFVAGSCAGPMELAESIVRGRAAAGHVLASLVPGRMLALPGAPARVDDARCSGCGVCADVCPYHAIAAREEGDHRVVSEARCRACGLCIPACPSGAIASGAASLQALLAEIAAVLE